MQRQLVPFQIAEGESRPLDIHCAGYGEPGSSGADDVSTLAPFLNCASADESAKVRTRKELKLLAAMMAHPSGRVGRNMETTRKGVNHAERIPS
jgi:hypothetical protein